MKNSVHRKEYSATGGPHAARESDVDLIAATKRGQGEAFEILFKRYQKRIFSVAFGISCNREDAEDIVQQCFMKAFVHLAGFAGQSAFSTWLTRIAINEALMKRRKCRPHTVTSIDKAHNDDSGALCLEVPDLAAGTEERYAQLERARILSSEANKLPAEMRHVVQLSIEERTVTEMARIMRVSVSTVKGRLFRARGKLRPRLTRLLKPACAVEATNGARAA
ncbi:MAG TPA: sigma-70 family RNA polymerase sigma factor [Candidatus Sulfotelmatobacter sp.]|nr:sigma-70 family RNA polymerase sigma factor [Candidatus Sulfotelmatobacter sp.]